MASRASFFNLKRRIGRARCSVTTVKAYHFFFFVVCKENTEVYLAYCLSEGSTHRINKQYIETKVTFYNKDVSQNSFMSFDTVKHSFPSGFASEVRGVK